MNRRSTIYTVLLVVYGLGMLFCVAVILLFFKPYHDRNVVVLCCLSSAAMTGIVLALRLCKSRYARIATRIANVLYLPQLFFGTALGIYGLLMVDRQTNNKGNPR